MNQLIMYLMAAGAVLGGLDRILGNRWGLGRKFEDGFLFLGPTALSMAGMICLAPLFAEGIRTAVLPFCSLTGIDPAVFGGILAIDMGGYQLAVDMACDPAVGQYAGIVIAAIFGCTAVFTIPVGMGIVEEADRPVFARGILTGLAAMPAGLLAGGLASGFSVGKTLYQNLPIFGLSLLLMLGLRQFPEAMARGFQLFAAFLKIVITAGLVTGAVKYMTGAVFLPQMGSLEDAMRVVSSIGIVMLGSLPMAELLQRLMRRPFCWLGKRVGINQAGVAGLLVGMVSAIPAITMLKEMDERGKLVNVAFLVSAASLLAAHLGFTLGAAPQMTTALLCAKLTGALAGGAAALFLTAPEKGKRK
ncbi:MAG: ethanolamine utilization protein EutH [Eubacteriales bacterium]|nr:ethanolamine utilization protein EutH [Eubacteriales bacterium]